MANKSVLMSAINLLEKANASLRHKIVVEKMNDAETQKIFDQIQKNESMILDYKFRIEYE